MKALSAAELGQLNAAFPLNVAAGTRYNAEGMAALDSER